MQRATRLLVILVVVSALVGAAGFGGMVAAFGSPFGASSTGPASPVKPAVQDAAAPTFQPSPFESVFVSITPCGIIDTRTSHKPLLGSHTQSYKVKGTTGFTQQGGKAGGCGVPATATAVAARITALSETANGVLYAGPAGQSKPRVITYLAHTDTTTGATLGLAGGAGANNVSFEASTGSVQLSVAIDGYYVQQMHVIVLADGTLWFGSQRATATTHPGTGSYTVTFDRDLTGCNVIPADNDDQILVLPTWGGGGDVNVQTLLFSSGAWTAHDEAFQLYVSC